MLYATWGIVSKSIGFVNSIIILSSLTLYQYGVFQLLLSAYGFFNALSGIGVSIIGTDVLRAIGEGQESRAKRLYLELNGYRLFASVLLCIAFFFGSRLLLFEYDPAFLEFFKVLSFLFISDTIIGFAKKLMEFRLDFGTVARRSSTQKLFQLGILCYFLVFAEVGVREVLISLVVSSYLSIFSLISGTVRAYRPWLGLRMERGYLVAKIFRTYGKWALVRQVIGQFFDRLQLWLIKLFISTEAVAIYSVADMMVGIIKKLQPTTTIMPLIALSFSDKEKRRQVLTYGTKYLVAMSLLFSFLAVFIIPPSVRFFYPKYTTALPYFLALLITLPIGAFVIIPSDYLQVLRKQKFLFYTDITKMIFRVPLQIFLLPVLGLWGMVLDRLLITCLTLIVSLMYFFRIKSELPIDWGKFLSFDETDRQFIKDIYKRVVAGVRSRFVKKSA